MTKTNRFPIQHHSTPITENFHKMPNDITRDASLGNNAFRLLAILYAHKEGWEVSANGIANEMGWSWRRAQHGLEELEQARYLIIQKILTIKGTPVSGVYHINPDGSRFSEADVALLSTPRVLPKSLPKQQKSLCQNDIHRSDELTEPPLSNRQNKEDQIKNQLEDEVENQGPQPPPSPADACVLCREPLAAWPYGQPRYINNITGLANGQSHDVCWFRWLIEDQQGQKHHKATRPATCPSTDDSDAWEDFHAQTIYADFVEQGYIPSTDKKTKTP